MTLCGCVERVMAQKSDFRSAVFFNRPYPTSRGGKLPGEVDTDMPRVPPVNVTTTVNVTTPRKCHKRH